MHPKLAAVESQFVHAWHRIFRLAYSLPEERWAARPDADRWSVAECVGHLNLTGRAYVPLLRDALREARTLGGSAPTRYRRDPMGWMLGVVSGPLPELGGRRFGRVRTAPGFVPSGPLDRDEVMAEFDRLQAEQIELTRAADGLPVDRVWVTSPFDPRIRYNLFSCLVILPRHQIRHVQQAERVWSAEPGPVRPGAGHDGGL